MAGTTLKIGSLLSANQLCEMIGLPPGSFTPIAWLVIQEMAAGSSTQSIAKSLSVAEEDLIALRDAVTGKEGAESQDIWLQGILTIKTAARLNQNTTHLGWDAIEAIALQKANATLSAMASNGDLEQMMRIAEKANKAIRRSQGEGQKSGGTSIHVNSNSGDIEAELNSGNLGMIRLRVSPAVAAQLQNPSRVIDGKVNRPSILKNMEMVTLDDIRDEGNRRASEAAAADADEKEAKARRIREFMGDD